MCCVKRDEEVKVTPNNIKIEEDPTVKVYTYDEALDATGHGKYNYGLLFACSLAIMGMANDHFGYTMIVTSSSCDLGLTKHQQAILAGLPIAGVIVMAYLWGYTCDNYGRRKTLLVSLPISFGFAVASSFSPNFTFMAITKLIGTACSSSAYPVTYSLLGESCGRKARRKYIMALTSCMLATDLFSLLLAFFILKLDFVYQLPLIGITFRAWRLLSLIMALPLLLAPGLLLLFAESPKLLGSKGESEEALETMRRIYKANTKGIRKFPVTALYCPRNDGKSTTIKYLWESLSCLFRDPYMAPTLTLFYLTIIIFSTKDSFAGWFPVLVDKIFNREDADTALNGDLCDVLNKTHLEISDVTVMCNDSLSSGTIWGSFLVSSWTTLVVALFIPFANYKKVLLILTFPSAAIGGISVCLTAEPASSLVFYILLTSTALGAAIIPAYIVDLYPTYHRGMALSLAFAVSRLSSYVGSILLDVVIASYCTATFYTWSAFVLTGSVATCFLMPDSVYTF